ncbi:DUF732 domain-containing protein [Mycobacterium sp. RTGN5]|uniref:DUF732 domain-containing protein n=1 Tax=Mycobacterium sp. RTGN5 TaxID=3016522 RepID=UPI0029C8E9EA|nr:DUF732 domain-containing protein [Mycobacterium sp. RTGN5]
MQRSLVIILVGPTAWLMAACSSGEDLVTTAAPPATYGVVHGQGAIPGPDVDLQSTKLDVTPAQRGFLDALTTAGVHPSSELEALSIGSHVCQAHAAGQSDQAVWDYIAPMVRSDVSDSGPSAPPHTTPDPRVAPESQVANATADYIRIATQRLC